MEQSPISDYEALSLAIAFLAMATSAFSVIYTARYRRLDAQQKIRVSIMKQVGRMNSILAMEQAKLRGGRETDPNALVDVAKIYRKVSDAYESQKQLFDKKDRNAIDSHIRTIGDISNLLAAEDEEDAEGIGRIVFLMQEVGNLINDSISHD